MRFKFIGAFFLSNKINRIICMIIQISPQLQKIDIEKIFLIL